MNVFEINIEGGDSGLRRVESLIAGVNSEKSKIAIGRGLLNFVRDYLFALDTARPNHLGGKRTHFYAAAARSCHFYFDEISVILAISKLGIRQRLLGGDIFPDRSKYLTIPAAAEAYGKTAREFANLRVMFGRRGGKGVPVGLIEAEAVNINSNGRKYLRGGKKIPTNKRNESSEITGGRVMFWLVLHVHQEPDPTVLPSREEMKSVANNSARGYLDLVKKGTIKP